MSIKALSLVGFMKEAVAIAYLNQFSALPNKTRPALRHAWLAAQSKLGAAIPNAGHPDIQEIPPEHQPYLAGAQANPRFAITLEGMPWTFKQVEIDPVLAFQVHVVLDRANAPCVALKNATNLRETLPICLPHQPEPFTHAFAPMPDGFSIQSDNPNLFVFRAGEFGVIPSEQLTAAGIAFGTRSPLVQVVRFGGRCYLKNGFHRVYGLRARGATHVPCLLLEASNYQQTGAPTGAFDRALLESGNPPTCGHLGQGRAFSVALRESAMRIDVRITTTQVLK